MPGSVSCNMFWKQESDQYKMHNGDRLQRDRQGFLQALQRLPGDSQFIKMLISHKLKNMIIAAAIIALVSGCYAEKVLSVNLIVFRNDSVQLKSLFLEDAYATKYISPGEYRLQITDPSKEVYSARLNIPFFLMSDPPERIDTVSVELRIPYRQDMRHLILYKNETKIFETDIILCNNNGVCDLGYETRMSCSPDCSPDKKDGVCVKDTDGVCDPDCAPGVDADCAQKGGAEQWLLSLLVILLLIAAVVVYARKKKK
jgi:hypothetical protein